MDDIGSSFRTIVPLDDSADIMGKFACGRYPHSHETKEFIYPEDLICDECTLQLEWETINGNVYECMDITITGGEMQSCSGKCHNGGVCVNGRCECREGFYGDTCEYKSKSFNIFNILSNYQ
jgi:hypothetical protein